MKLFKCPTLDSSSYHKTIYMSFLLEKKSTIRTLRKIQKMPKVCDFLLKNSEFRAKAQGKSSTSYRNHSGPSCTIKAKRGISFFGGMFNQ